MRVAQLIKRLRQVTQGKGSRQPVIIRGYRPDDLESCRRLWVELTEWHRHIYQSPEIGGPDPGRHFDKHLQRVGPEHIWVAEVDGQVVGMAGLIPGEQEAEIEPLVVSESHRGSRIGQQLTRTIIEAARERGFRQIVVRPVARNELAIRFFHNEGFDVLGQVELLVDLRPKDGQKWRYGARIAERDFRL